jgi:hypothetical protein
MLSSRLIASVLSCLIILALFPMHGLSQSERSVQNVTKGKVIEISKRFITVGTTTIALPPKIKALDINGTPISFRMIKKGDYVSVKLGQHEAIIKKILQSAKTKGEEIVPQ